MLLSVRLVAHTDLQLRQDRADSGFIARLNAAPLRAAEDAIVVDTSALDFDASREALLALIRERLQ